MSLAAYLPVNYVPAASVAARRINYRRNAGLAGRRRRGLGDVLSDAAAKFAAAGITNATCFNEHVPGPGGTDYTQPICSVPGYQEGFSASATAAMSPAQIQAEMQNQLAYQGPAASYLTSNIGGGGTGVTNWGFTSSNQFAAPTAAVAQIGKIQSAQQTPMASSGAINAGPVQLTAPLNTPVTTATTPASSGASALSLPASLSLSSLPSWAWLAGGGLALVLIFGGHK